MKSIHAELWQRIQSFSFDGSGPVHFSFARRLARENGWSISQSQRAIFEYKRFVFLAHVWFWTSRTAENPRSFY